MEAKQKLKQSHDENFKKIFNFLYNENLKIDFFKSLNVDLIFEIRILSVDSKWVFSEVVALFYGTNKKKKKIDFLPFFPLMWLLNYGIIEFDLFSINKKQKMRNINPNKKFIHARKVFEEKV